MHDDPTSQSPQGRPIQGPDTSIGRDDYADDPHLFVLDGWPHLVTSLNPTVENPIVNDTSGPLEGITSPRAPESALSLHPSPGHERTNQHQNRGVTESPSTESMMTSQDIYLCITVDYMAATGVSEHPTFSFFVKEVNPPVISPYDHVNWNRLKTLCVDLSIFDKAIRAAILAVQALYKVQATGLDTSQSVSLYKAATNIFASSLDSSTQDIDIILIVALLLCLFQIVVPSETESVLSQANGPFVTKLEAAALQGYYSPVALRISAWFRIIHAATRRSGNPGILSTTVNTLLPNDAADLPSLFLFDKHTDAATPMYDIMSAPIFMFYLQLQNISTEVANLSHYHRSRTTGEDQEEVSKLMACLKARVYSLWQTRPGLLRLEPFELRAQFSPSIAESLITLVGITTANYYAEIVEIGRTLSDPPLASLEAKQAMRSIRSIVDSCGWSWNGYALNSTGTITSKSYSNSSKLDPGYLRPLFIYAIESIPKGETEWAVDRMMQINNHICRSEFFARFADSLAGAQRNLGRRVTTKYFCYQTFGVAPPFL
jgi:hypothetical protein